MGLLEIAAPGLPVLDDGVHGPKWIIGAGLGYSTMFLVSASMALVAMAIYAVIFFYMHSRKSVSFEGKIETA